MSAIAWAKVTSYPWWPCVVDDKPNASQMKEKKPGTRFVKFFGSGKEWAWLPNDRITTWENGCDKAYTKASKSKHFVDAVREATNESATGARAVGSQRRSNAATTTTTTTSVVATTSATTSSSAKTLGEQGHDASDDDEDDDVGGMSAYERARMKLIAENQKMLASLGLSGSSTSPRTPHLATSARSTARPAGLTPARKRPATPIEPSRRSSRIKGETADDVYITRDAAGSVEIAGSGASSLGNYQGVTEAPAAQQRGGRLPEESLTLESTGGTEEYGEAFLATLRGLSRGAGKSSAAAPLDGDVLRYAGRLAKLRIGASGVAKVCPERIYSAVVHPTADSLVVTCGDKWGNLGVWRVGHEDEGAVALYRPHTSPINMLQYHPNDDTKLFSLSYDGTVRCMDIVAGKFDFVAGLSASGDITLQHGVVDPAGATIYSVDTDGVARCHDIRTGQLAWEVRVHDRKANTIDVHPTSPHYLATASLDKTVKLWDARALRRGGGAARELALLPDTRSVNAASFSPGGDRIVAVSQSDRIALYVDAHTKSGELEPTHSIRHDNKTGRWLSVFHARWDPKTDHAFVVGSMMHPRQAEVYTTEGGVVRRIMSLQDPEWMGSVQSRFAVHPSRDVIIACNSSGRAHCFH